MEMTVEIDGRRYPLPNFANPTFREARAIKAATGMAPLVLAKLMEDGDPDAWGALVLMAMRSDDPRVPDSALDDVDLYGVMASWADALEADPTEAAEPAADGGSDPAKLSSEESTPESTGTPSSLSMSPV